MKKTRKIKFTLGMKIASVLCCVALLSVGFASWWIVQYPTQAEESGSFTVYKVDTKKVNISTPTFLTDDDSEIVFGAPTKDEIDALTNNYGWLGYNSSEVALEDLSATLGFTVSVKDVKKEGNNTTEEDSSSKLSEFITEINVAFDAGSVYEGKIGNGVATPIVEYRVRSGNTEWGDFKSAGTYSTDNNLTLSITNSDTNFSKPLDNSSLDIQVRFTFGWSYANGTTKNPYLHYNASAYGDGTLATQASEVLTNVYGLYNAEGQAYENYSVTINTNPSGN